MTGSGAKRGQPLALTMGDPAGIGLEITLKAWLKRTEAALPPFLLYADAGAVGARARLLGLSVPIAAAESAESAAAAFCDHLPVEHIPLVSEARPGAPEVANAPAVIASIETAVEAVRRGEAAAVVTNPVAKSVLSAAGFGYPGHTEFLGHLAGQEQPGRRFHPVMMLACDELKVVPLTVHVPLADVPRLITRQLVFETVRVTFEALRRDFGIAAPRLAVTGLNPHAGEQGTIGREDIDIIAPAIQELRAEGLSVTGPHPADTLFHAEARRHYDAAVTMYHDQALIPLKTLAFETGVNVTLGLPFIRTSPDHGTAFDIAAEGRASPESLIAALRLAGSMVTARLARP
jgi:4-hydroxythreonine-4-phosphate dehydrogenase